jgi:hypothetical protein
MNIMDLHLLKDGSHIARQGSFPSDQVESNAPKRTCTLLHLSFHHLTPDPWQPCSNRSTSKGMNVKPASAASFFVHHLKSRRRCWRPIRKFNSMTNYGNLAHSYRLKKGPEVEKLLFLKVFPSCSPKNNHWQLASSPRCPQCAPLEVVEDSYHAYPQGVCRRTTTTTLLSDPQHCGSWVCESECCGPRVKVSQRR